MTGIKQLRAGVIGCGGIAQMMHLPFLDRNTSRFRISALCDLSKGLTERLGERYRVAPVQCFTDYQLLLEQDLDIMLVTSGGDHTPIVRAALQAGRHVFVEKPLCYSLAEAEELTSLAQRNGLKLMVGYMKRFDPAYRQAQRLLEGMGEIRYVQMNTLHPEEEGYLDFQGILPAGELPQDDLEMIREREARVVAQAIGNLPQPLAQLYTDVMLGSMVHDINTMRGLFGEPDRVLFAEHWPADEKPGAVTTMLQYPGNMRVVYTWIFLPELREYFQEIAVMSSEARLRIQFPSPYLKHFPTPLVYQHMQEGAAVEENITVSYEEAFELELLAFHDCVVNDRQPLTGGRDARQDIYWLQQILAALNPAGLGGEAVQK